MTEPARRARNESRLQELFPTFRARIRRVIKRLEDNGLRPRIQDAHRSPEDQLAAFNAGHSKLKFGFHNVTAGDGTPEALAVDMLDDDMLGFARDTNAAQQRERLHDFVANAERIEYLRSEDAPNGGYVRHLYRYVSGGTTSYFTAGWRDGKLHRLRYEEE